MAAVIDKYQDEFKLFIANKIDSLKKELIELEGVYDSISRNKLTIPKVDSSPVKPMVSPVATDSDEEYNQTWTWIQKIKYLLIRFGPLTTTEVVGKILEFEPDRSSERTKVVASVSAVLSINSKPEKNVFGKGLTERNENLYSVK